MATLEWEVLDTSGVEWEVLDGTVVSWLVQSGPVELVGGGGGSLPSGTAGQVPQVESGSTYELVTPNTPNGLVRLDGDGTIPDILIPASIARDSEVAAAIAAVRPDVTLVPYIVTGNVTVSTLEAALGLIAPGIRFLLGNAAVLLDTITGSPLGVYAGGTVTGGSAGIYQWDGTDLTFVRAAAEGDLLATYKVVNGSGVLQGHLGGHAQMTLVDLGGGPVLTAASVSLAGAAVTVDASGFNGNLTPSDNTLQEVAQKLDDLAVGGTVDVVSNVAQDRIIGRVSSGSGDSEELTAAQVRALLDLTNLYSLNATRFSSGSYYGPPAIQSGGTRTLNSGNATATPWLLKRDVTISSMQIDLTAASASSLAFDLHLFATDSSGYPTGAPVATATLTTTGTGTQVLNASTGSVALTAGLYFGIVHNRSAGTITTRSVAPSCHIEPMPHQTSTSANQLSCWLHTGAGTSAITSWAAIGSVTGQNQGPIAQIGVA